ncbi:sensor domain-containing diguanylate cyclase [Chitinimonas lacunae]|uniref:Diguanylate cyclase domain-containing protein n=1 Tax=Chitinimonas lacunae TaxID=1963018 RepID=A0ABV8MT14_9NEIS
MPVRPTPPRLSMVFWLSLSAAFAVLVTSALLGTVISLYVERYAREQAGNNLIQLGWQMSEALDQGMAERYEDIETLAQVARDAEPAAIRPLLEQLHDSFPHYAWIGFAAPDGRVLAANGGLLEGADVSSRPWHKAGLVRNFVGDVHPAVLLAKKLPSQTEPWRFVDVAIPLRSSQGELRGVLGAHLSWNWAGDVSRELVEPALREHGAQALVLRADGTVLLGPGAESEQRLPLPDTVRARQRTVTREIDGQGRAMLTAYMPTRGHGRYPGLGWIVMVRQSEAIALADFHNVRRQALAAGLVAILLIAGGAVLGGRRLARPLDRLTAAIVRHQAGQRDPPIPYCDDYREVHLLSRALIDLDLRERQQSESLNALNADLERRIDDRTTALAEANRQLEQSMAHQFAVHDRLLESQRELRDILQNAFEAYICLDEQGCVREWNRQAERTFGWTREEALNQPIFGLILPPRYRDRYRAGLAQFLSSGSAPMLNQRTELAALHKDGHELSAELTINAQQTSRGFLFHAFLHDIGPRKAAEQALQRSRQQLQTIADSLPALVAQFDRSLRFTFANAAYGRRFGIDAATLPGRSLENLLDASQLDQVRPHAERALTGRAVVFEQELRDGEGRLRYFLVNYLPQYDLDGMVCGFYAMEQDITERKQLELQLAREATEDPLTGLPNRRALMARLDEAVQRYHRQHHGLGLLFLDLDRFKSINDEWGHDIGDEMIRQFGTRIRASVRITDTVARLAGDEFVVILENLHQPVHDGALVAGKILAAMEQPFELSTVTLTRTASIGAAVTGPGRRIRAEQLLATADGAMYRAKQGGRNNYVVQEMENEPDTAVRSPEQAST